MNQKLLLFFAVLFVGIASAQTFSVGGVNYSVISTTNSTVGVVASASYVGALVVPSTVVNASVTYSVVSISDSAFQGSTTLTSITIPNTVTEIRNGAFRFCTNLSSVDLGTSVTSIGQLSFASCSSLTSIVIPGSVASIGIEAFSFCTSLTSVTVNWPTPISVNTTAFVGVNVGSATLNVPLGTVGLYEAAPVWQDFGTIMQPQSGSHLNFDGVNDYVTVNVGAANLQVNNYTHELWFRTTSPTGTLFNNAGTGAPNAGQHNKVLSLVGGKLRSYVYNGVGSFIESTTNFNDGNWHHVAEIVSTTERRLYVDGILVGTSNALPTQNLDYITLGNSNYTPLNYYNGDIDEVRIWNVARTLDQIYASKNCELQGTETGLVAYYKFNQGISQGNNTGETTLINSVATGANGTLTNFTLTGTTSNFLAGSPVTTGSIVPSNATVTTPVVYNQGATATALTATPGTNGTGLVWYTTATGGIGTTAPTPSTATAGNTSYWVASTNANGCESVRVEIVVQVNAAATHLNFGGTTDYVNCGNSPSLQITGTAITLEAYVKFNSFGAASFLGNIINKDEVAIASGYMLRAGGNGVVNFVVANNGWSEINSPENSVTLNTWHHIAGVYDGVNAKIYIDGVQVVSQPLSITIGNANVNLNIGKDPSYSDRFIDASIDEVRIWNRALPIVEIQNNMNCELPNPTTQNGLVAYYQFNQGADAGTNTTVTTLTDASVSGNNGTLTNFALTGTTSNWLAGSTIVTGTNCAVLSSSSFDIASNINVYPNPTNGSVNVETNNLTNVSVSVYDLNGRQILNKELAANENAVDISNFQSGLYLFRIKSTEGETVKKVIKN